MRKWLILLKEMSLWKFLWKQRDESRKIHRISADRGEGDTYSRQEHHHIAWKVQEHMGLKIALSS